MGDFPCRGLVAPQCALRRMIAETADRCQSRKVQRANRSCTWRAPNTQWSIVPIDSEIGIGESVTAGSSHRGGSARAAQDPVQERYQPEPMGHVSRYAESHGSNPSRLANPVTRGAPLPTALKGGPESQDFLHSFALDSS